MKIAILTTDNREAFRDYSAPKPYFGTAPEALLQGFAQLPEVEVHVISGTRRPMASPEKIAPNIWFHSLHVSRLGWTPTLFQGVVRAARHELKRIRPDIVHGQGTERDCALSAVFSGHPNVLTIHGNMAELARLFRARAGGFMWLAAQLENVALKRTSGVFCNSGYTENLVKSRAPKTWRVSNPLREQFFAAPSAAVSTGKCILLNIGLVSERKRQLELLDVTRRLHERGLVFELHFIGAISQGAYGTAFRGRLKEAEAAGYARHIGFKSTAELIAICDAAHGLVHFPSEEAFGLAAAEALARELKFFGARLGGLIDICKDAPGAELFAADDWAGLTDALAKWMQSGHPKSTGASQVMRERYHPLVIARRHMQIYREVLGIQ